MGHPHWPVLAWTSEIERSALVRETLEQLSAPPAITHEI
jgi:hypothetical protein